MGKWQDAHIGANSPQVAFRATEEEKQRLELLRQELRLTSVGQVVRVALDALEQYQLGLDRLTADPAKEQEDTRRAARRVRRHLGAPHAEDLNRAFEDDEKHYARVKAENKKAFVVRDRHPLPLPAVESSGSPAGATDEQREGEKVRA